MIHVLLVEDDPEIARSIRYYLGNLNTYDVIWADSAEAALKKRWESFQVILLDVMLPGMDGVSLCHELREYFKCPILFISCLDDTETVVKALSMGGDDYLVKPFDNQILDARIQANIRRVRMEHESEHPEKQKAGELILQPEGQFAIREGKKIEFSDLEYRLLSFLVDHIGQYFESQELYYILWGNSSYGDTRTVAVHIFNLRQKLEPDPAHPKHIINVRGKGYTYVP